jgi:penicillin-binding protein 1B
LSSRLSRLEKRRGWPHGRLQGTVIVTGTQTGEVLALVGDRDPSYAGFNRALEARRPIGSLVKPAVYLTALSHPERYHVLTPLNDTPLKLKNRQGALWIPHNYNRAAHGTIPMYRALAQSYNLATVRLGMDMGIARVSQTLKELGVEGAIPTYPAMLLGAIDLSPFEVAQMYQTLASGGFYTPLRAIREVLTAEGKPLKRYGLAVRQVIPAAPSFLINYLLTEVVSAGTARELSAELPAALPLAGKTGTTNDLRDSWFAGFGSDVLAVAWVGRDDNQPAGLSGASGAMRVWADIMKRISPSPVNLTPPAGIEWRWIDQVSGKQTDPECPGADVYPFMPASRVLDYQLCNSIDSQETGLTKTIPDLFQ